MGKDAEWTTNVVPMSINELVRLREEEGPEAAREYSRRCWAEYHEKQKQKASKGGERSTET